MKITPDVFEAYLKCPTKCWLRATGEPSAGNTYSEWVKTQNESYRTTGTARLVAEFPNDEVVLSPDMENRQSCQVAVGLQLGGAGADGFLCPGIRTPRGRTRARRRPGQAGSVHPDSLRLHQQAEQGRQTAAGLRCLRALEIAGTRNQRRQNHPRRRPRHAEGEDLGHEPARCGSASRKSPRCWPILRRPTSC